MVHNGIEYGDMQLIAEAYDIMKRGLGLSDKEMGDVLAQWNKGVLDSYLIEITRDILYFNDDDGTLLLRRFSMLPAKRVLVSGLFPQPLTIVFPSL